METFETLNAIYEPLCKKSREIAATLRAAGYKVESGFFNNHYIKSDNGFLIEHFPIPVLTIPNVADIGIRTDAIWVEFILSKEKAVELDYSDLAQAYNIEVYGTEGYLHDLYDDDPDLIAEKIQSSGEAQICVTATFDWACDPDKVVELIVLFLSL
ncbi:MAG: DUF3201 domain-containing protein [Defluviitaleaceae bacterium]|nr:DUF3201 domain-containing protein [Defluviitaleaceae bacterium]